MPDLPLEPLGRAWYRDESTWYLAPATQSPGTAPCGSSTARSRTRGGSRPRAVAAVLADPASPLVPDTRALFTEFFA